MFCMTYKNLGLKDLLCILYKLYHSFHCFAPTLIAGTIENSDATLYYYNIKKLQKYDCFCSEMRII